MPAARVLAKLTREFKEIASIPFAPLIAAKVVKMVSEGFTLREVCKRPGMPSYQTFYNWMALTPDLAKAYKQARALSAQMLEEEALDSARHLVDNADGVTAPQVAAFNALLSQLRWSAEKRDPGTFGTNSTINVKVPIQINTTLNLGEDEDRLDTIPDIYTVNVTPQLEKPHGPDVTPRIERHPDDAGRTPEQAPAIHGPGLGEKAHREETDEESPEQGEPVQERGDVGGETGQPRPAPDGRGVLGQAEEKVPLSAGEEKPLRARAPSWR